MPALGVVLQANWLFQLLLGRYREERLRVEHFVVFSVVAFVAMFAYFVLLRRRLFRYQRDLDALPGDRRLPLRPEVMSRRMWGVLAAQEAQWLADKRAGLFEPEPQRGGRGDPGLIVDRGEVFDCRALISKSYLFIDAAVISRRPELRQRYARTIRDYVTLLQKEFPDLPKDTCARYLELYERARYGRATLTRRDYEAFARALREICDKIERGRAMEPGRP
jgi:hypothetical protein